MLLRRHWSTAAQEPIVKLWHAAEAAAASQQEGGDGKGSQGSRETIADERDAGAKHLCGAQVVCCIAVCSTQHDLFTCRLLYVQHFPAGRPVVSHIRNFHMEYLAHLSMKEVQHHFSVVHFSGI